jgi:hypothetical protein
MQLILNDLMGEYMIASDNLAADNLLAAANSSGVWDGTPEDFLKSVYDAANDVSSGRNWMPTHMFVSVDVWSQLGQLVDSSKPSIIPIYRRTASPVRTQLGNSSASSWNGNPIGLQLVVDSNFAAKDHDHHPSWSGPRRCFRVLRVNSWIAESLRHPSVLGRNMLIPWLRHQPSQQSQE